jgi:lysophospholipase L1-like esterase
MKPIKTLLFTIAVFVLLAGTMLVTPAEGVKVGEFNFHMPTFSEMFSTEKEEYTDVTEIIEHQIDIDSLMEVETNSGDSVAAKNAAAIHDSLVQSIYKIEITDEGRENLSRFFQKLKSGKTTRIMHYGDSQLEGDRITANFRNKLQIKFNGTGIGLRPAVQPYDFVFSAVQTNSPNWTRYPIYGNVDTLVRHNRYGVMGAFSRFAPLTFDSIPFENTLFNEAELSISKSTISFNKTREYKRMRLFYGNAKSPVDLKLFVNGEMVFTETLKTGLDYDVVSCDLPAATDNVVLKFSGFDSPDIYGVELVENRGVIVDNIALRGSSGTIFTQTDFKHSTKMYTDLDPGLFILQFGGNVMPYIKDQKAIDSYGRWFAGQIKRLKQSCPGVAVIVIGPSDMSTKIKDKFVTYEYLPAVVQALKNAALSTGSGYWDMYQAMGGYNSMPGWVNAKPELAAPDYVHFTPKGSTLISNMFYNAFILEYNNFLKKAE